MDASIWTATLASFRDDLAEAKRMPAAVSAAAVAATLGFSLLIKVLRITGKRSDLIEAARLESARLGQAADDDIRATGRQAIEVPLQAASSATAGLKLCAEATPVVTGSIAADLEAATALLSGAVRAILVCVDSNLQQASPEDYSDLRAQLRLLRA